MKSSLSGFDPSVVYWVEADLILRMFFFFKNVYEDKMIVEVGIGLR